MEMWKSGFLLDFHVSVTLLVVELLMYKKKSENGKHTDIEVIGRRRLKPPPLRPIINIPYFSSRL